ncbi:hypothetical protein [Clostridium transplantifaecale]|uniref:hypothetical protein n=1 Tax=Clostridium transplantifaecale TaxID=2479838 RepID=UPI000F62DF1D|nr:hypothetical protein [Clostridium transplantifaecale]
MRLIKVSIDGYKHLKGTCVNFNEESHGVMFTGDIPIRFFVGLNGSGKSVFLEGICLLFSRIVQDEVPGFQFNLIYKIQRDKEYRVEVSTGTGGEKLDIKVFAEEKNEPDLLHSFEKHRYLLPDYVFTCASGSNNNFFDIVVHSPMTSLYSDLYDMSLLGRSRKSRKERERAIGKLLLSLKLLEENPICVFIDEKSSVFVLAAFFAILPKAAGDTEIKSYIECRRKILSMLDSGPAPMSLSFVLDEKRVKEMGQEVAQYGAVFDMLIADSDGEDGTDGTWDTVRLYQDEAADVENAHGDRVITFLFDHLLEGDTASFYIDKLSKAYESPMEFLSKLILAYNKGLIRSVHIGFKINSTEDVVEENALSEGEFMLLVRLGLLALGRYKDGSNQCLYLMDEPDVYLNEHWDIDFVSMIHQIYESTGALHEIVIATHSSLMLTDAFPEQLYYFQQREGQVICRNIQASTFGGSRNEIMEALFLTGHSVGSYSNAKIEQILDQVNDVQELETCLKYIGSGYLRMRLLDKIQILRREKG